MISSFKNVKRGESGKRPEIQPFHNIILLISDRSASMNIMERKPYEGVVKLIKDQKDLYLKNKINSDIRLVLFNDEDEVIIGKSGYGESIRDVGIPEESEFEYRGLTKLYDTVIDNLKLAFNERQKFLSNLPKKIQRLNPDVKITFVLITDGLDNSSKKWTRRDMRDVINEGRKHHNMTAFYIATDGMASNMSSKYGFSKKRSLAFTPSKHHCQNAFDGLSTLVKQATSSIGNADIEFPELVRTSSSQAYNKQVRFKKYNFMAPPKPPAADMLTSYLVPPKPLKLVRQKSIHLIKKNLFSSDEESY